MKKVIAAHIIEILTDADVAHTNLSDEMLVIIKGQSLRTFEEEMGNCLKARNSKVGHTGVNKFRDLVSHNHYTTVANDSYALLNTENTNEKELACMHDFVKELGTKHPMITIGSQQDDTVITISYKTQIKLEIADPRFFDQLDAIIDHLLSHDDLSEFSGLS